jgi:hypothetical protein
MTMGEKIIEEAIKLFEKEGYPLSLIREMMPKDEGGQGSSLRVAILHHLPTR